MVRLQANHHPGNKGGLTMTSLSIQTPGPYIPAVAIDFAAPDGTSTHVSAAAPLPTSGRNDGLTTSTALAGIIADTAVHLVGPFVPQVGRDIWVTINATSATGNAQLLRSTDGGTTRLGLTAGGNAWASWVFTATTGAIVNEQVLTASDGATYYLAITLAGGSASWRIGQ